MAAIGSYQQRTEMRKHRRQPLHYPAVILLGPDRPPIPCTLSDISNSGAKITLSDEQELPDRFILVLSRGGNTRRNCRVVWREDGRTGVEFFRGPLNGKEPKARSTRSKPSAA
jgi:hypothetical protein